MKVYYDADASLENLKDKNLAVIGYGSQGHAHALNLKDSGLNVAVGLRKSSARWKEAEEAGLKVMTVSEAAEWGDIVMILLPDQNHKEVYENEIKDHLKEGNTLAFGHGFNILYNQVVPPKNVNVMMIAPKSPGHLVRRTYQQGSGTPCLIAVEQDFSGNTKDLALAWAKGIGGTRAGVIETNFKDETETDLSRRARFRGDGADTRALLGRRSPREEWTFFACQNLLGQPSSPKNPTLRMSRFSIQ